MRRLPRTCLLSIAVISALTILLSVGLLHLTCNTMSLMPATQADVVTASPDVIQHNGPCTVEDSDNVPAEEVAIGRNALFSIIPFTSFRIFKRDGRHVKFLSKSQHLAEITLTKDPMNCQILSSDNGRLGNQLFEYVTLLIAAEVLGKRPCISRYKASYLASIFSTVDEPVIDDNTFVSFVNTSVMIVPGFRGKNGASYVEPSTITDRLVIEGIPKPLSLIKDYKEVIARKLNLRPELLNSVNDYFDLLRRTMTNGLKPVRFVGIQVRRSDYIYILMPGRTNCTYPPASLTLKQIQMRNEFFNDSNSHDIIYVVASDDPKWVRKNIVHPGWKFAFTVDYHQMVDIDPASFDFAIIASTHSCCISYGTYAFWAAYLSGGHVFTIHWSMPESPESPHEVFEHFHVIP